MNNDKKDPRSADYMAKEAEAGAKERELRRFFDSLPRRSRRALRRAQERQDGRREGLAGMMERLGRQHLVVAILGLMVAASAASCTWDPNRRKELALQAAQDECRAAGRAWDHRRGSCRTNLAGPKEPASPKKRR